MKYDPRFTLVLAFGLAASLTTPAWAQEEGCDLGKVPVTILTGKGSKIICVSPQAAEAIENAPDHAQGTIIPDTCPETCFTPADVELSQTFGELVCSEAFDSDGNLIAYGCENGLYTFYIYLNLQDDQPLCTYCYPNDLGDTECIIEEPISQTESDACIAILPPPTGCISNVDCSVGEYCRKSPGMCEVRGECVNMPANCPQVIFPVCGCDDMTYENDCLAAKEGVNVQAYVLTDPNNCGACGITCDTGYICIQGLCELP